jgi:hypothetical protein
MRLLCAASGGRLRPPPLPREPPDQPDREVDEQQHCADPHHGRVPAGRVARLMIATNQKDECDHDGENDEREGVARDRRERCEVDSPARRATHRPSVARCSS